MVDITKPGIGLASLVRYINQVHAPTISIVFEIIGE
jgi:hypothetical protein